MKIELLNQISDGEHYSRYLHYNDTSSQMKDCTSKVTQGNCATVGWGITTFISNKDLNKTLTTCQYLKDDCLFFQINQILCVVLQPWLIFHSSAHPVYSCCHSLSNVSLCQAISILWQMQWHTYNNCDCLSKNLPSSYQNWIEFNQFTDTLNIHSSPVYQVLNVNWSTFLKGILPTLQVTAGTMAPMEGTNWTVETCICFHWLCGPPVCHWPLCGRHGRSWGIPIASSDGFCHLPPHPPPLLSILMEERDGKKYHEIQPSEIEEVIISYNKSQ